ncbi:MAG: type II/IV secretion system protein [Verrucomicrobia bacterium]|nr:type II/IV secretion system protein [Verrucomicrobiota bacterium]
MNALPSQQHAPDQDQHFIVALIEELFARAVESGASDIHLEPLSTRLRVRFRCDGILREVQSLPQQWQAPLLSCLKIMTATLNIAEKRLPQEGRFELEQHGLDVRVATIPTSHGESMTLRLLNPRAFSQGLNKLGLDPNDLESLQQLLQRPDGLILITGPTGSGKTTTLYTCLQTLAAQGAKVMTIEDPVEYRIPGVNQVQVHEEIGLTFSHALRSLLRQATNKIMVGEIRDATTLESVLQASLTGHLVFSTLHTHDTASAVVRLKNMGASAASLATSLRAVIAQRLVRRHCEICTAYSEEMISKNPTCSHCRGTGFRGRMGIFEILLIDETLRHHLHHATSLDEWTHLARQRCTKSLHEDGMLKVAAGLTTVEEILKVTRP